MKKVLIAVLSLVLMLGTTPFVSAADEKTNSKDIHELAYLDYYTASPEMKERILEARKEIIFSSDWVADGYSGCIQNVETGEVIKTLPSFSTLFPDWDLPVQAADKSLSEDMFCFPCDNKSDWTRLGSTNHYLQAATDENATPFVTFYVDPYDIGTNVRTYATSLTSSETCNIGYSNATTGTSLGYATYLRPYEALTIYNVGEIYLSVRASTFSIPGWSTLAIDSSGRWVLVK